MGTGWLGWTPEQVLTTPIPQIVLAIEGLVDFTNKSNPLASTKKPNREQINKVNEQRSKFKLFQIEARRKATNG